MQKKIWKRLANTGVLFHLLLINCGEELHVDEHAVKVVKNVKNNCWQISQNKNKTAQEVSNKHGHIHCAKNGAQTVKSLDHFAVTKKPKKKLFFILHFIIVSYTLESK